LPYAPAVWGSLPPVVVYQVLGYLGPAANVLVMALFVLAGSFICVQYAPAALRSLPAERHRTVVADQLAGQGLTMLMIAAIAPPEICNSMALGFIAFRFFDITRPWPCRLLARKPAGVGTVAPALAAGVYGGIAAIVTMWSLPAYFR
jgi:phosphatidylglycerophosphatase A